MHMPQASSLPYLNSPTRNLSLSNPNCNNDSCQAFYQGSQQSQAQVPWTVQFYYGHYTAWFYVALLGLATIAYHLPQLRDELSTGPYHRDAKSRSSPSAVLRLYRRGRAAWRFLTYRRLGLKRNPFITLPSTGICILMLLATLYLALLTFISTPYYRYLFQYGSPPLAVRTGLMSVALTPLIFALAGKANPVTFLTGLGHEKLNVLHRGTAWLAFVLAIIHTVPFIVQPLQQGGPKLLHQVFYTPGSEEFSGIAPLAMLFGLVAFSLPFIRRWIHEAFYGFHVLLATAYLGLMFWHANDEGDSWVYLWVSLFVFVSNFLVRLLWFHRPTNFGAHRWLSGEPIKARTWQDERMMKLTLPAPEGMRWTPGQHVYLRIPAVGLVGNHPFTISNSVEPRDGDSQKLRFILRARDGFTQQLYRYITASAPGELRAWVDGPYGGIQHDIFLRHDTIVLMAGGGGITACIPWLEAFISRNAFASSSPVNSGIAKVISSESSSTADEKKDAVTFHELETGSASGDGETSSLSEPDESVSRVPLLAAPAATTRTRRVKLIWSVRQLSSLDWIDDTLARLEQVVASGALPADVHVEVEVHLTGDSPSPSTSPRAAADASKGRQYAAVQVRQGRVDMYDALAATLGGPDSLAEKVGAESSQEVESQADAQVELADDEDVLVVGCGPDGFNVDLSNACAALQMHVWARQGSGSDSDSGSGSSAGAGAARGPRVASLALHTEVFGW